MIRSLKALALVLTLSPIAAFAGTAVDVHVKGMSCGACVKKVNDELAKLTDIEPGSVKVSLEKSSAVLTLKKDDAQTRKAVTDAVTNAGFTVAKIDVVDAKSAAKKAN